MDEMVGDGLFDSIFGVYRMNMGFSRLPRQSMKKDRDELTWELHFLSNFYNAYKVSGLKATPS